ncbi:MAG: hypothetical protein AAF750_04080 [Planctomycetota bacterium]
MPVPVGFGLVVVLALAGVSTPAQANATDLGPQPRPADHQISAVYAWSIQNLDQVFIDIQRPPIDVSLAYTLNLWRTSAGPGDTRVRIEVQHLALRVNRQPVFTHPQHRRSDQPAGPNQARDAFHRLATNTAPLLEFTDAACYEIEALARLLALADGQTFTLNTASPLWAPDPQRQSTDAFIAALAPKAVSPIPPSVHHWYFYPDDEALGPSRRVFLPHHARIRGLFYNHLKLLTSAQEANGPLRRLDRRLFLDPDGRRPIAMNVPIQVLRDGGVFRQTPNPVPTLSPLVVLGVIPTADQFTTLEIDPFRDTGSLTSASSRSEEFERERARQRRRLIADIQRRANQFRETRLLSDAQRGKLPTLDGPAAVELASRLRIAELRRYRIDRIREDPELDIAAIYLSDTDRHDLWLTAGRAVTHRARPDPGDARLRVTAYVPSSPTIRSAPGARARLRIRASLTWQADPPLDLSIDRWVEP